MPGTFHAKIQKVGEIGKKLRKEASKKANYEQQVERIVNQIIEKYPNKEIPREQLKVEEEYSGINSEDIIKKLREKGCVISSRKEASKQKKTAERPKEKAPKGWFDKMKREVKEGSSDYTEEQVNATVGKIWWDMGSEEKAKINREYRGRKKRTSLRRDEMSYKIGNWNPNIKKKAQGQLSLETLNAIIDEDEVSSQIKEAIIALKVKYPEKSEVEIFDAVNEAVGDGPLGGYGDVETTIEYGEQYLLEK